MSNNTSGATPPRASASSAPAADPIAELTARVASLESQLELVLGRMQTQDDTIAQLQKNRADVNALIDRIAVLEQYKTENKSFPDRVIAAEKAITEINARLTDLAAWQKETDTVLLTVKSLTKERKTTADPVALLAQGIQIIEEKIGLSPSDSTIQLGTLPTPATIGKVPAASRAA